MNRQWAAFFGRGLVRTTEDFGYQGEPPTPSRVARLAGRRVHGRGLVAEANPSADRHERHLPAIVAGHAGTAGEGPTESAAGSRPTLPHRSRDRCATRRWRSGCSLRSRRPERLSAATSRRNDRGRLRRPGWKASQGEDRYRRGLYTFTKRTEPLRHFHDVRCSERRGLRRPPRGLEHATAGLDAVERHGLVEAAQALGRTWQADGPVANGSTTCSAAAWPGPRRGGARLLTQF